MPTVRFSLKPDPVNTLVPLFVRQFWVHGIAAVLVYLVFMLLLRFQILVFVPGRLIVALVLVVFVVSLYHCKMMFVRLHRTRYVFYDTHVVREFSLLRSERQSMPYKQINKIQVDAGLWDRLSRASDIVLSSNQDHSSLVLQAVKHPHEVEHRIYTLMKQARSGSTEENI